MNRDHYACSDDTEIEMRFFPLQGVLLLIWHGNTHELQQQLIASGFLYTNGPIRVQGKVDEADTRDRTHCSHHPPGERLNETSTARG